MLLSSACSLTASLPPAPLPTSPSGDLGLVHATDDGASAADREPVEGRHRAHPTSYVTASARLTSVSGARPTVAVERHNDANPTLWQWRTRPSGHDAPLAPHTAGRARDLPTGADEVVVVTSVDVASMMRGFTARWVPGPPGSSLCERLRGIPSGRRAALRPHGLREEAWVTRAACELRTCRAHPWVTSASLRARRARRGRDGSGGERGSRGPARSPPNSRGSHRSRRSRDRGAFAS
jgi:hypothetical protein